MTFKKLTIRFFCLLLLGMPLAFSSASAGPARPGVVTMRQSDGTTIRIRVHGDEFHHYVTTEEGYSLAVDSDGDWAFARLGSDGLLVPTSVKAKPVSRLTESERMIIGSSLRKDVRPTALTALQKRLLESTRTYSPLTRSGETSDRVPPLLGGTTWKPVGNKKVLVLLAEYPDLPFTEGSNAAFNNLLNSRNYTKGGATGSVWQYYHDNSNGMFSP